jgi:membrane-associated phospholipid phosphatase
MRSPFRIALLAIVAIVAAHLADRWAYAHLVYLDVYDHDLGRMLRTVGYLPVWWLVGLAVWLQTRDNRSGLLLGVVPTAGGAICDILQVLVRRERPRLHEGHYVFRSFTDRPFHGAEFGMPSSHTLVAFSAAWLLCRLYPRAWPVWIGLATACAVSRVESRAHFLSDVTVATIIAYFLVEIVWRRWGSETRDERRET